MVEIAMSPFKDAALDDCFNLVRQLPSCEQHISISVQNGTKMLELQY
jgi:hypothetical protein